MYNSSILLESKESSMVRYQELISSSKNKTIESNTEVHHILPKCLGGNDNKNNLCELSIEDHILAHLLLVNIYPEHAGILWSALVMLCGSNNGKRSETQKLFSDDIRENIKIKLRSKNLYGIPRRTKKKELSLEFLISENLKIINNLPEKEYIRPKDFAEKLSKARTGKNHNLYGWHHSSETRAQMRDSQLGNKNHFYGKTHQQLSKNKISFTKSHYVIAPDGTVYGTIGKAAKAAVMSRDKLSRWLYSDDQHGYRFLDKNWYKKGK